MKYLKYYILFGLLLVVGFLGITKFIEVAMEKGARIGVSNIRHIVMPDNKTSRTIIFEAKDEDKYEILIEEKRYRCEEISFDIPEGGEKIRQYKAEITGLEEGKEYEYIIVKNKSEGKKRSFKTDSENKTASFLVFADTQSSNMENFQKLITLAKEDAQDDKSIGLISFMGDMVDNGALRAQWNSWFAEIASFEDMLLSPVIGNHECYDKNWKNVEPTMYLNYFDLVGKDPKLYYSYDYGNAHIVVLYTAWNEYCPEAKEAQVAWLKNDLKNTTKKWKIVLMHHDALQYKIKNKPEREEGFSVYGETFMPIFDEGGVDVVLSAHLHTYRNRGFIKNFGRAEKGPLYILTGISGNSYYDALWEKHKLDEKIAPSPERGNYLKLSVDKDSLIVKAYLLDGKLFDEVTLKK